MMEQILEQVPDLAQCTLEDVTNRVADAISAGNRSPKDVGDLQAALWLFSQQKPSDKSPKATSAAGEQRTKAPSTASALPNQKRKTRSTKSNPPAAYTLPMHLPKASKSNHPTKKRKTAAPAPSRTSVPTMPLSTSTAPADPYSKKAFYKPNNRRNRVRGGQAVLSAV